MAKNIACLENIEINDSNISESLVPVCLGGQILSYSYAREFWRAYHIKPIVISMADNKITSSSRYVDYRIMPDMTNQKALLDYLSEIGRTLEESNKVGMLLGGADWHARFLSENREVLEQWFVIPYIDIDLMDHITQKNNFYNLCEKLDIDYPKTWSLDLKKDRNSFDFKSAQYPLVGKPSSSAEWDTLDFAGKKKVYIIENEEELHQVIEAVSKSDYNQEFIIQEFIPGDDDALYSLTIYAQEGKAKVVSGGRVILQDHAPSLIGNPVCIMSQRVEKIIEDGIKFVEHTGYSGYANFDVKYDERDGKYKFFEVNARPGRNSYYISLGGVNFITPFVEDFILQKDLDYTEAYNPFLYTLVPPVVIKKSVSDTCLRREVLRMYKSGLANSPLSYGKDTFVHGLWNLISYYNQIPKFKKYLWDVNATKKDK